MSVEISQTRTPKSFFVAERDRFYSDWVSALWRELIQNSVDAGAKNIIIDLNEDAPNAPFGRIDQSGIRNVTKLSFKDDGSGMTEDVLRNIYLVLGETTKKDEKTIGGYGRARIMTTFSQLSYTLRTKGNLVIGDGPDYTIQKLSEESNIHENWAETIKNHPDYENNPDLKDMALRQKRESLIAKGRPSFVKGCEVEIDIDSSNHNTKIKQLTSSLQNYLRNADISCNIIINGTPYVKNKKNFSSRRTLTAYFNDMDIPESWKNNPKIKIKSCGDNTSAIDFAKVYVLKNDKDNESYIEDNSIHIRVNGVPMIKVYKEEKTPIIVELYPELAREAMTSNRDSLRNEFSKAMSKFEADLSTNSISALRLNNNPKEEVIFGGKGYLTREEIENKIPFEDILKNLQSSLIEENRYQGRSFSSITAMIEAKIGTVNGIDYYNFLKSLKDGIDPPFINECDEQTLKSLDQVKSILLSRDILDANDYLSNEGYALSRILALITFEKMKGELLNTYGNNDILKHLSHNHHIPFMTENLIKDPTIVGKAESRKSYNLIKKAIEKFDPRNWNDHGQGLKERKILMAWQVAVQNAIEVLSKNYELPKDYKYLVGFRFANEDAQDKTKVMATFQKRHDNVRIFNIDPLNSSYKIAYDVNSMEGRQKIIGLAIHEVCHEIDRWHSEKFTQAFTSILMNTTPEIMKKMHKDIENSIDMVDMLYSSKTQIIPMDSKEGIRPSQRLSGRPIIIADNAYPDIPAMYKHDHDEEISSPRMV